MKALLLGCIIFILWCYLLTFIQFNVTGSLPRGVYLKTNRPLVKNALVTFCPPYDHYFEFAERNNFWKGLDKPCGKTPRYMKKIVGVPYDNVSVTFDGVFINNVKIKNSEPVKKILSDKIFQDYEKQFLLKENEYFLMSDYNNHSFDSRYFGVIHADKIKNVVIPLWVGE